MLTLLIVPLASLEVVEGRCIFDEELIRTFTLSIGGLFPNRYDCFSLCIIPENCCYRVYDPPLWLVKGAFINCFYCYYGGLLTSCDWGGTTALSLLASLGFLMMTAACYYLMTMPCGCIWDCWRSFEGIREFARILLSGESVWLRDSSAEY